MQITSTKQIVTTIKLGEFMPNELHPVNIFISLHFPNPNRICENVFIFQYLSHPPSTYCISHRSSYRDEDTSTHDVFQLDLKVFFCEPRNLMKPFEFSLKILMVDFEIRIVNESEFCSSCEHFLVVD